MMNFNVLGLELTKACMNRCTYCYNKNTKLNSLNQTDLKKVLNLFLNQVIEDECFISLLGGEPLIRMKTFIPVFEDILNTSEKKIHFTLNTNGILLNEENCKKIQFLKPRVAISLDGPKDIHNLNRFTARNEPTYDMVVNNLPYIFEYFPENFCQATFTPSTIHALSDSYFLAKELGFKEWYWAPDLYQHTWEEEHFITLYKQLEIIAKDYKNNKTMIYKPFESKMENRNDGNLRFGKTSKVLLAQANKELKISRLNATCIDSNIDKYWYIGDIDTGIDYNKIQKWLEQTNNINADQLYYAYNTKNECAKCSANNICYNSNHEDTTSILYHIQCMQPRMQCEQKKIITTIKNLYLKNQ